MIQIDSKYRYMASCFCDEIFHCNVFMETYQGCIQLEYAPKEYRDDENLMIDLHTLEIVHISNDVIRNRRKARWQAWADSVTYNKPMEDPEEPPAGECETINHADLADKKAYHFLIRLEKSAQTEAQNVEYDYYVMSDIEECCQFFDDHAIQPADESIRIIDLFHLKIYKPRDLFKARYMLLGGIIGDTVGSVYEFDNIYTKQFPLFSNRSIYTDDSIMTLAVADVLQYENPKRFPMDYDFIREQIIQSMQKWGRKYPNPKGAYGNRFTKWLMSKNPEPYNSLGNGSAMRVSAVGWVCQTLEQTLELAAATADITHNHPEGIKGAQATAAAIFLARTGKSVTEIRQYIESTFRYDLSRTCDQIREVYTYNETCQGTVPEALTAAFEGKDFEDVIRLAVSLGGDCDTLTCIAGSVAGALFDIPKEIAKETMKRLPDDMLDVFKRFSYSRLIDG